MVKTSRWTLDDPDNVDSGNVLVAMGAPLEQGLVVVYFEVEILDEVGYGVLLHSFSTDHHTAALDVLK